MEHLGRDQDTVARAGTEISIYRDFHRYHLGFRLAFMRSSI
jgi:hypothetical protein